ncbi:hypothetical protein [Vulcanisaeta thermophila]|uniref:hypothetical protein n=1 Tax=Vulcanisaeta thermophila TaxID=867917 RepID=UPI000852A003|nr:hypothetical protein [Vulcanisaeta thermophila]
MESAVIITTAPWDYHRDELNAVCNELISRGINCRLMDYEENEALKLLLKYGIKDGMVRIPSVFIIHGDRVIQVTYEVRDDLTTNIRERIMNELSRVGGHEEKAF